MMRGKRDLALSWQAMCLEQTYNIQKTKVTLLQKTLLLHKGCINIQRCLNHYLLPCGILFWKKQIPIYQIPICSANLPLNYI